MNPAVRKRAIVYEALIRAGGEGVRAVGRYRGFGCHAGVPDTVRAGHLVEREAGSDPVRTPDFLEDLHAPAAPDDIDVRRACQLGADFALPCHGY